MRRIASFTPTGCLLNALRRDLEKGYDKNEAGYRTTREVQEFVQQPIAKVRRELTKLSHAGIVSGFAPTPGDGMGNNILWVINDPLKPGDRVKVERQLGSTHEVQEAEVEAIIKSCVLPVQVRFDDGHQTGYLQQEIREIVHVQ
jgi:hypothetical protein